MSSTLSNPQFSIAAQATIKSGAAPATTTTNVNQQFAVAPTVGTAAGNINGCYSAPFSIASGSNLDLDLSNLVDPNGTTLVGTMFAGYMISVSNSTGGSLTIGGGTNPIIASAESDEPIPNNGADGRWFGDAPRAIDGTHHTFRLTAGGGVTVNGQITIFVKT